MYRQSAILHCRRGTAQKRPCDPHLVLPNCADDPRRYWTRLYAFPLSMQLSLMSVQPATTCNSFPLNRKITVLSTTGYFVCAALGLHNILIQQREAATARFRPTFKISIKLTHSVTLSCLQLIILCSTVSKKWFKVSVRYVRFFITDFLLNRVTNYYVTSNILSDG